MRHTVGNFRSVRRPAHRHRLDIVDLIYGIMDSTEPGTDGLSKEMRGDAKTVNVILGKSLYSDSWLEV